MHVPPSACTIDAARIGDTSAAIYGLEIALNSGRAALTRARARVFVAQHASDGGSHSRARVRGTPTQFDLFGFSPSVD
jgi:hypothetical protein